MRIDGKILIAMVGFVVVAGAGALGMGKFGGFALIKEFYPGNGADQVTAAADQATTAADQVTAASHQITVADVAKNVQTLKHETRLPKTLDTYTELVDIRADGRAVVFVHRLTIEAKPSKAYEWLAAVRRNMLQRACNNKSMPSAMNQGVVFRYQYADVVGFDVGSFDIGGNDCAGT
jgi:hypothetical protein